MNIVMICIIICVIGGIFALIESIYECKHFVVTHYNITPKKWNGNSIGGEKHHLVVLSDLHNKEYDTGNKKLLDAIRKEDPAMILIAGDMLIGQKDAPVDIALSFVNELAKIAPVYYGNGNHEQRMKDFPDRYGEVYKEYKEALKGADVTFLENESVDITLGAHDVRISGLEIDHKFFGKCSGHPLEEEEIIEKVGKNTEKYEILLAHHPVYSETYVDWGADLVLSGHLHGGIIRLPFLGALITPQFRFFPKYSGGHYQYKESDIVVSKGIGEHTVNLRFMNKPEVVVLHLQS